jgi:hypothetical protein
VNYVKKKKQHYVPRFYLKGFTQNNSEQLFIYNKDNNKIYQKNIVEVCEQNYYYSYKENENEYKEYNYMVENYLSKKETEFGIVFDKIISSIEGCYYHSNTIDKLTHKDKVILFEFIYYQILRVPKYIDKLIIKGIAFIKELNKKYNHKETEKEMVNYLKKTLFPKLFENVQEFIGIMNKRNLAFYIIDKNIDEYFISSDNPVIISNSEVNVNSVGIIDPMTEITIPISKNIILIIHEKLIEYKLEYNLLNSIETIKNLNTLIKNNSMKFIYSSVERILLENIESVPVIT